MSETSYKTVVNEQIQLEVRGPHEIDVTVVDAKKPKKFTDAMMVSTMHGFAKKRVFSDGHPGAQLAVSAVCR